MKKNTLKSLLVLLIAFLCSFKHPLYLSVTELKYNAVQKNMEGSVRVFVNDFEEALEKIYHEKFDLIHVKDSAKTMKVIRDYIKKHLVLSVNDQKMDYSILGYEHEMEGIWIYFECKSPLPKKLKLDNSILYDYLSGQSNIVHAEVNGTRKSSKVDNPDKEIVFEF